MELKSVELIGKTEYPGVSISSTFCQIKYVDLVLFLVVFQVLPKLL